MKKLLPALLLLAAISSGPAAQAQVTLAETQALTKQLHQLQRNPKKPNQEVQLTLAGCHAEQVIRDRAADVHTAKVLSVSYSSGNSGWAVKMDEGVFEMKMSFEWADVAPLTYKPGTDDEGQQYFQVRINKHKQGSSSSTSFELRLYTASEATAKEVVRRLEKVRQSCGS